MTYFSARLLLPVLIRLEDVMAGKTVWMAWMNLSVVRTCARDSSSEAWFDGIQGFPTSSLVFPFQGDLTSGSMLYIATQIEFCIDQLLHT